MFHDFVNSSLLSNTYIRNLKIMILMNLFVGKEWTHRCREWTYTGEMNGESSINMHTGSGVRQIAGGKLLCSSGSPASGDELEWGRARGGRDTGIIMADMWCWRRLLRVPWTARRSNQSILKEISPECSLEGLMLKLKLK